MLDLPLTRGARTRVHLSELLDDDIEGNPIRVAGHCYGCTAGQGSSCGGALERWRRNERAMLSIIMPVLERGGRVSRRPCRRWHLIAARGVEIIVVDGGSSDGTAALARPLADRVIAAPRGRALQMNAGAAVAQGDVLLFLHADTRLPDDADRLVLDGLARRAEVWGRFDVRIDGGGLFALISSA